MEKRINLLDEYKDYMQVEKEASENSIKGYLSSISIFMQFKFNKNDGYLSRSMFDKITEKDLVEFKKYLMKKENSGGTIITRLDGIISLLNFMEEDYKIDIDSMMVKLKKLKKSITVIKKKKDTMVLSETKDLLNYIKNDETKVFRLRNYFLFSLILSNGLRITETLELKEEDIDINNKVIIFSGKTTKGNKAAILPLKDSLIEVYKEFLDWKRNSIYKNDEYLFTSRQHNRLCREHVGYELKEYLKEGSIVDGKNIHLHSLRSTVATLLNEAGATISDIQAQLRHASITTTMLYINKNQATLERNRDLNPLEF